MTELITICTDEHNREELTQITQEFLLDNAISTQVADLFSAFADPTRVRIVGLLAQTEMCVGDLCLALEMSQPAISHQLRVLRNLQIVRARKEGRHVFYTLLDEHIHDLFRQGLAHIQHE